MGVNAYFGPRQTTIPHETAKYKTGFFLFEVYYYRQTYCSPKYYDISGKTGKVGQEVMHSSNCFNYDYM